MLFMTQRHLSLTPLPNSHLLLLPFSAIGTLPAHFQAARAPTRLARLLRYRTVEYAHRGPVVTGVSLVTANAVEFSNGAGVRQPDFLCNAPTPF